MTLFIRYDWSLIEDGIDIKDFWESLIGFQEFSKEIFRAGKLSSDIDIKVTSVRKGSIIVDIVLEVKEIYDLFESLEELLYFLQIVAPEYYTDLQKTLTNIGNDSSRIWKNLEMFARDNPVAGWLVWAWIYDLIKIGIKAIGKFHVKVKPVECIPDTELIDIGDGQKVPASFLKQTKKIIASWKSMNFLEPIVEENIKLIQVGDINGYEEINEDNFDYFIWEGQEILPELKNGEEKIFKGSFTGMQSNHGETMTFKSSEYRDRRGSFTLFCCFLPGWKRTEDFKDFYGESKNLKLTAEVYRSSQFKKPKLILKYVEVTQTALF